MSADPAKLSLPLSRFFARLQAAGFPLDPAREWQLREVFYAEAVNYIGRFGELKFVLAPFAAKNDKQQQRFYELWDQFVADLETEVAVNRGAHANERPWWFRWRRWLLGLLLLPLLLFGIYALMEALRPPETKLAPLDVSASLMEDVRQGDTINYYNNTPVRPVAEDSIGFSWRVIERATEKVLLESDNFDFSFVVPPAKGDQLAVELRATGEIIDPDANKVNFYLRVLCPDVPPLEDLVMPTENIRIDQPYTYSVTPREGISYNWNFDGEQVAGPRVQWTYRREGPHILSLTARKTDNPEFCFRVESARIVVGSNRAIIPPIALKRDTPHRYLRVATWAWLLALLPALGSIPLWINWYRRRHRPEEETTNPAATDLFEKYEIADTGPYNIPYLDRSGQISVPADFYRIADLLRVREAGMRRVFDGQATVTATVQAGGFPRWRDKSIKQPARYLVLREHTDEFNQQDRLLERLTRFLIERESALEVYLHGGAFNHFWNAEHPTGYSPTQLHARYADYRLILLGNGHGLVEPYQRATPALAKDKLKWLRRWPRRLLLTTEPVADWSFQEVVLQTEFLLFPLTTAAIRDGVAELNEIDEYEAGSYTRHEAECAKQYPEPGYRHQSWDRVNDYYKYFAADSELFRWLSAMSVSQSLDWNLTIAIGRALGVEVTHDRLLQLSRIPWLAANAWNHDLRLAFLERLYDEDEATARTAVLEELSGVSERVKGSFAATEHLTATAVQEFALAPASPQNKQRIRELREIGFLGNDQLRELENGLPTPEDQFGQTKMMESISAAAPPPSLDEWLREREEKPEKEAPKEPWFTFELFLAIGLCVISFVGCLAANDFERANHPLEGQSVSFWQTTELVSDRAIDYLSQAVDEWDKIEGLENLRTYQGASPMRWAYVDHYLNEAKDARLGRYPLADTNLFAARYDRAAKLLNYYALDSLRFVEDGILPLEDSIANFSPDRFFGDTSGVRARELYMLYDHLSGLHSFYYYQHARETGNLFEESYFDKAQYVYAHLDTAFGGWFFDSLAVEMPVNLGTLMLEELARRGDGEPSVPSEEPSTPPQTDPETSPLPDPKPPVQQPSEEAAADERLMKDWLAGGANWTIEQLGDGAAFNNFESAMINGLATIGKTAGVHPISELEYLMRSAFQAGEFTVSKAERQFLFFVDPLPAGPKRVVENERVNRNVAIINYSTDWMPSAQQRRPIIQSFERAGFETNLTNERTIAKTIAALGPWISQLIIYSAAPQEEMAVFLDEIPPLLTDLDIKSVTYIINSEQSEIEPAVVLPEMVKLPDGSKMGKYEVTRAEFRSFEAAEGIEEDPGIPLGDEYRNLPMASVDVIQMARYCNWLSRQNGLQEVYTIKGDSKRSNLAANGYRLPTQMEWTFAASGGYPDWQWSGTNDPDAVGEYANYLDLSQPSSDGPQKVGRLRPNGYGLYDMSGNVSEVIEDKAGMMGGSFLTVPENSDISSSVDIPSGSTSSMGFRVFHK